MDALELCLDYHSLRGALTTLPKTLDETYSRTLTSIPPEHRQNALKILQLLTYSERPLLRDEVVDAIAVNVNESPHFSPEYRMPDPQEIARYCSSLVAVVTKITVFRGMATERIELQLAHLSVQEYLTSDRVVGEFAEGMQETNARTSIANIYLAYLLHFDSQISIEEVLASSPLARLSATRWMDNIDGTQTKDAGLTSKLKEFFCFQNVAYRICYSIYRPDQPWLSRISLQQTKPPPALYYAAMGNLVDIVSLLLKQGVDINAPSGSYGNALQAASAHGHQQVVKLLLHKGADIHASGGIFGNALTAASFTGNKATAQLLLDNGADIYQLCEEWDPEDHFSYEGVTERMIDRISDTGMEPNELDLNALDDESARLWILEFLGMDKAIGVTFCNALEAAVVGDKQDVLELLLDQGADVNRQGGDYDSLLGRTAHEGNIDILDLLLSRGADLHGKLKRYGNVLGAAAAGGSRHMVQLLLHRGVKINVKGDL